MIKVDNEKNLDKIFMKKMKKFNYLMEILVLFEIKKVKIKQFGETKLKIRRFNILEGRHVFYELKISFIF
jgi:hypothetical protein